MIQKRKLFSTGIIIAPHKKKPGSLLEPCRIVISSHRVRILANSEMSSNKRRKLNTAPDPPRELAHIVYN
jgi:hypothetical protein